MKRECVETPPRREFIQAGGCFMFALAALGLPPGAAALPVVPTSGTNLGHEKQYSLPAADGVNVDRQAQVILVRFQNSIYAFALSCPHENAAVKWLAKDHRFQCTKHDSEYQANGTHTAGRATRNMDRFAIRRDGPNAVVDLGHWFQSDKDPTGWASAAIQI
jgi:nitrite reductase/ring-hydroxylating ferredoxin subunit